MTHSPQTRYPPQHVDIVVPVYNEAVGIRQFHERLYRVVEGLPCECTIWYVDDGSEDQTAELVDNIAKRYPSVRLLELSRNFGHQIALTAGIDHADGDVVITMDGDGQHPPELIPTLIATYQEGYDIVLTQRVEATDPGGFKRMTSRGFYWLINRLSNTEVIARSADFRLMSRDVVLGLREFREYHRFLRGLIIWMGYRRAVVRFEPDRRIAGTTKYSLRKMVHLASNAVFSFSTLPLKLAILLGFILVLLAAAEGLYTVYFFVSGQRNLLVPGWASLMFAVLGIGGVQLIMLGVIGQYIGLIFQEAKRRPLYLLRRSMPRTQSVKDEEERLHERVT
jgi:glycosyltransferase involved in cell wall biosynthesis